MTNNRPVVVVGAGPVGLVLALRLERFGVPVIVLEKNPDIQNDLRASTFHPPTLEMLDEFGLTAGLLAAGLETPTWQIRMHETGEKAEFDLGVISEDTRYPFRLQAEQRLLCELATDLIADIDNIDLRMGHELTGFDQSDEGATLQVKGPNGADYDLEAPFLIAADGGRSTVRTSLDLKFEGLTYPETTILATTTFPFHEHIEGLSNVNYIWFEGGTFSLLRLPGLWRCSLYAGKDQSIDDALRPENIEARLQTIVPKDTPYEVGEIRPYRIHQRILEDYRVGRILFAGDAAHLNSPSGGMGMNGGIHDAVNLAEKLMMMDRGEAEDDILDLYDRQRRIICKDFVQSQSIANKKAIEAQDPEAHKKQQEKYMEAATDPKLALPFLRRTSMIDSVRDSYEIA